MLPKSHQEKVKAIAISIMPSTIPRFHDLRLLRGTTRAFVYFHSMTFNIYHIYKNKLEKNVNFVITKGKFNQKKSIPVRVLSNKIKTKNILNNSKIKKSLNYMSKFKNFSLLIINNKNNVSEENNINTLRYYGIGAQIIKDLNIRNMILISRSKKKIIGLDGFGLKIKKQIIIK